MRYLVCGVQRVYVAGEWREPGIEFSADVDPGTEQFMVGIGALRRVAPAAVRTRRREVTEE